MIKVLIPGMAFLVVLAVASFAWGQGFVTPSEPSIQGGANSGFFASDLFGWIRDLTGVVGTPTVRFGYLGDHEGVVTNLHVRRTSIISPGTVIDGVRIRKSRLSNPWFAASLPLTFGTSFSANLNGGLVIPCRAPASPSMEGGSEWDYDEFIMDKTSLGYLEGEGLFNVYGSMVAVAGFRWDQTNLGFSSKRTATTFYAVARENTKINGYLPFCGLLLMESSPDTKLLLRVVGSPFVAGDYQGGTYLHGLWASGMIQRDDTSYSGSFSRGQFLDAFFEYKSRFLEQGSWRLFAGFTFLRLEDLDLGFMEEATYSGYVPGGTFDETRLVFTKKYWTVGVSFNLDLTLP